MERIEDIPRKRITDTGSFSVGNESITIQIVTEKHRHSGLVTTATCLRKHSSGIPGMLEHLLNVDYYKVIKHEFIRATEKNLRSQHEGCIIPAIVDDAIAFYKGKK
jgi:hypothetical protein